MYNRHRRKHDVTVSTHQRCLWHTGCLGFYMIEQESVFSEGLGTRSTWFQFTVVFLRCGVLYPEDALSTTPKKLISHHTFYSLIVRSDSL